MTKFVEIVATDDDGKSLLPELPTANCKVWVRGYGSDHTSMQDLVSTDKEQPHCERWRTRLGGEFWHGQLVIMDPRENFMTQVEIPAREDPDQIPSRFPAPWSPST